MNWISILGDISIWIILLPAVIGLILINKLDQDSKLVLTIVLIGCVPQVLRYFNTYSTWLLLLYNLYTPLEFFTYWILFRDKIHSQNRRRLMSITAGIFLMTSFYFIYRGDLEKRFINEWVVFNNIFQILWIGLCLMEYYYSEERIIDFSQPFFWFLIGITSYSTCTAVFYSLWHFIHSNFYKFNILNAIHHIFNIVLYIFFSIGFLKNVSHFKNGRIERSKY